MPYIMYLLICYSQGLVKWKTKHTKQDCTFKLRVHDQIEVYFV